MPVIRVPPGRAATGAGPAYWVQIGDRARHAGLGEDHLVDRQHLQELRIAIHAGDGDTLVAALLGQNPTEVLQLAGDAIAGATAVAVPGATELAEAWAVALRTRGWTGDEELAAELDAALGRRPPPQAKALPINLDELADVLEAALGEEGGAVDLVTGEVWPPPAIEYARETDEDPPDFDDEHRWLWVPAQGSDAGYEDMEEFIATVDDPARAERLERAMQGKGAFRRFKDAIANWPEEQERWFRLADERRRGRARQWLADAGYRVAARPRPDIGP